MGGVRFWTRMVKRWSGCGGRQALAVASHSLIPPGAMCYLPHIPSPEQPPPMEDESWAAVREGPHLHTVTRSEGHEGGRGIGIASISLAHPCMAPGLLPAWGWGGATWGQMGRWDWEEGEIRQRHQTPMDKGGDQTEHPQEGQAQGKVVTKGKDKAKKMDLGDRQTMEQRSPMEWECTNPISASSRAPARSPLTSYILSVSFSSKPQHKESFPTLFSLIKPLLLSAPLPIFLAHTPPHFLGAWAPPPLQTCSAHPAVAGRIQHS